MKKFLIICLVSILVIFSIAAIVMTTGDFRWPTNAAQRGEDLTITFHNNIPGVASETREIEAPTFFNAETAVHETNNQRRPVVRMLSAQTFTRTGFTLQGWRQFGAETNPVIPAGALVPSGLNHTMNTHFNAVWVAVVTPEPDRLATPQNLVISGGILTWSRVPGNGGYQIQSSTAGGAWIGRGTTLTNIESFNVGALGLPAGTHNMRVIAIHPTNPLLNSHPSTSVPFTPGQVTTPDPNQLQFTLILCPGVNGRVSTSTQRGARVHVPIRQNDTSIAWQFAIRENGDGATFYGWFIGRDSANRPLGPAMRQSDFLHDIRVNARNASTTSAEFPQFFTLYAGWQTGGAGGGGTTSPPPSQVTDVFYLTLNAGAGGTVHWGGFTALETIRIYNHSTNIPFIHASRRDGLQHYGWFFNRDASTNTPIGRAVSRTNFIGDIRAFAGASRTLTIFAGWTGGTTTTPGTPQLPTLAAPNLNTINGTTLTWTGGANNHGFRIYANGNPTNWTTARDVRTVNLANLGLPVGTHQIRVRTLGFVGISHDSVLSPIQRAFTVSAPPVQVVEFTLRLMRNDGTNGAIDMDWNASRRFRGNDRVTADHLLAVPHSNPTGWTNNSNFTHPRGYSRIAWTFQRLNPVNTYTVTAARVMIGMSLNEIHAGALANGATIFTHTQGNVTIHVIQIHALWRIR